MTAQIALGIDLDTDPVGAGGLVVVVTADRRVRALAARDLSLASSTPLESRPTFPPEVVGGRVYVADQVGNLVAIAPDGQRAWSVRLPGAGDSVVIVAPPRLSGETLWCMARDGTLHARTLTDGAEVSTVPLRVFASSGPLSLGNDLVIPDGSGSLRLMQVGGSR